MAPDSSDITPNLSFPPDLPVSQRIDEIADAIRDHQVVIVVGDTGSGKTTQLPKLCLALGRGRRGKIGHTQPRRLAARSVAARIAEETQTELGQLIGYKVRFQDAVGQDTRVKLLTDGMLLAETRGDKLLKGYDTLIIDEAHERGLNIDFLLGYLKRLLPKRRDLKVIITSATINYERFSAHFNDAPVVMVEGRTFPVEVRYRPLTSDTDDAPMYRGIVSAVDELRSLDQEQKKRRGDVLVFLPGEREIRGAAEALRRSHLNQLDVLPLYARLSASEQQRIFHPTGGDQRIVLATNVAETSLTVPGIRYVIDSGLARMSRYSYRSKVQRLPIEAVSQASANQRKGRCG
ncbi:MAG: helicase-related protein, partial [Litorivicinus sp.]